MSEQGWSEEARARLESYLADDPNAEFVYPEDLRAALAEVERLKVERQALLVLWQDGPSLPDCHACAVVGAALRGEGEK